MDERVLQTQQWLNTTYANNAAYIPINEDGQTGNATFTALIKALQIELGNVTVDGSFGDATMTRLAAVHPTFSQVADVETAEENNYHYIIQGSLWCKGYNPGGFTGIFGPQTAAAIKSFQSDAGLTQDGVVRPYLLQGIMNTDGYKLDSDGDANYRSAQLIMNSLYAEQIGLTPSNGLWDRKAHKNLIKACQIEWGATPADGVFGDGTYSKAPTLSQNTSGWTASKRLLQIALTINGFYPGGITGTFGSGTKTAVTNFQDFVCIGADGIAGKNTWASLLKSCGYSGRSATACDTSVRLTATSAASLVSAGYDTVGRYLTNVQGGTLDKKMTKEEIQVMAAAGLKVFPIYQENANSAAYFTYSKGVVAAEGAKVAAQALGFPSSTTMYFAVDYDCLMADLESSIIPYFNGVKAQMEGKYKIGAYAPRAVCRALSERNLIEYSFVADMSSGFTGNIGVKMPENWAYDQFHETNTGIIPIDKCVASPRATAISAAQLSPSIHEPNCAGPDCIDVHQHHMILADSTHYECAICHYRVKTPEAQDASILSPTDLRRVIALHAAYGMFMVERQGGHSYMYPITATEDNGTQFYFMPEKCLRAIDMIRSENNYKSQYEYCGLDGNYTYEFADTWESVLENNSYPNIFASSTTITGPLMLSNYNNLLSQLKEFLFGVFAAQSNPIFAAVTSFIQGLSGIREDPIGFVGGAIDYLNTIGVTNIPSAYSTIITAYEFFADIDYDLAIGDGIVEIRPLYTNNAENLNVFFYNTDDSKAIKKSVWKVEAL